jgi:hypothetical protein
VFIVDADPEIENVPLTNKLPLTLSVLPSKVRFTSALAAFGVPSEVNILLSP